MLDEAAWQEARLRHEQRVDRWIVPVRERARRGEKHPVDDFLWTYYSIRPGQLRRWSPGDGVVLAGPAVHWFLDDPRWEPACGGVTLRAPTERVLRTGHWVVELLARTASRPASFGCFGLHEWAMVHGQDQQDVRHASWPLRLGTQASTAVVDALPVRCSHFDAFRFFTDSARPLNELQPSRGDRLELEQPGCLHATMDLYKWAGRLMPWVASELVADCFELALHARELDMRASPYDLTALGYPPVRIETVDGRREYVAAQREIAARGGELRGRLLAAVESLVEGQRAHNRRLGEPGA